MVDQITESDGARVMPAGPLELPCRRSLQTIPRCVGQDLRC